MGVNAGSADLVVGSPAARPDFSADDHETEDHH
jgi:hypothetical protein